MKIINGSNNYNGKDPLAIAMGNFDGVHLGHQYILKQTVKIANETNSKSAVYTFNPHPARIVAPFGAPPLIQTLEQRLNKISEFGIDICIVEEFTKELSILDPLDYFNRILLKLNPSSFILGYDFTFGRNRSGNTKLLKELSSLRKISIDIVEPQFLNGTLISSTIIRQLISSGMIEEANKLLGHNLIIEGVVEKGAGKGKELGFPTANIHADNELIPGPGVYITETIIDGKKYPSATFTGPVATFGRYNYMVEAHILEKDFDMQLLDKNLSVSFMKRLRDSIAFSNVEDLKKQIAIDVAIAGKFHGIE